jgi:CheY-like chemotaxis protein
MSQNMDRNKMPLILLAEDVESVRVTLKTYLQRRGYRVIETKSGPEAVDIAERSHPQVIILDLELEGFDGITAIQKIRQIAELHETPIVAMTHRDEAQVREEAIAAGSNECLLKPFAFEQLGALVAGYLSENRED